MSAEAIDMLVHKFRQAIDYGRKEFDLSYAEVLGTLRIVAHEIEDELMTAVVSDEDDEADDSEAWKE